MKSNQKKFTEVIEEEFRKRKIPVTTKTVTITEAEPLIALSNLQREHLLDGDGQKEDQYKQVNSSTGLVVNYFKMLEELEQIYDLDFEDKVARPLGGRGGKPANLDASFIKDGKKYYVESKFLEPYYSGNETNRDAYFTPERYAQECQDNVEEWIDLFSKAKGFKVYNVAQLCRHLLAIYRKSYEDGFKTATVLQSIVWFMTDKFIKSLSDAEDAEAMLARRNDIEIEAQECEKLFNAFINRIGWKNMSFEAKSYNDEGMLNAIRSAKEYEQFKERYFID